MRKELGINIENIALTEEHEWELVAKAKQRRSVYLLAQAIHLGNILEQEGVYTETSDKPDDWTLYVCDTNPEAEQDWSWLPSAPALMAAQAFTAGDWETVRQFEALTSLDVKKIAGRLFK